MSILVPYTVLVAGEYWMDDFAARGQDWRWPQIQINKLSDEFGQYAPKSKIILRNSVRHHGIGP